MSSETGGSLINFAVIGVVKGGTTSLYHYLKSHPDVYLPSIKETNHFSAADINSDLFLKTYARDVALDLDSYIAGGMRQQVHIAHVDSKAHYKALFAGVNGESAVGEISNSYMLCPSAAGALHRFNPEAGIIVILRNPIGRAWSHYLMNLREAKTNDPDFIREMERDHAASPSGWGINHGYLELGKYAEQLNRYLSRFGKNRVFPVFYEDYKSDPQGVLKKICAFLEVDDTFEFDYSEKSNAAGLPRFPTLNRMMIKSGAVAAAKKMTPKSLRKKFASALYTDKGIPKLQEHHRSWLRDFYHLEVAALAEMIGQEVYEKWPDFKDHG